MPRRIVLLVFVMCLTAVGACGPLAGSSAADAIEYRAPRSDTFWVPRGVTSVHVVVIGGHGGGFSGGRAAVVRADLPVTPGHGLGVQVAASGDEGGFGGGGAVPFGSAAGRGGGASYVMTASGPLVVAGGGGGGGGEGLTGGAFLASGGDGGDAGQPGGAGATVAAVPGGGGGGAGGPTAAGSPGAAGPAPSGFCVAGTPGVPHELGLGGTGGAGTNLSGRGDGGGGGGGLHGGGGGGAGGYCPGNGETRGGGGGGGGSSLVPPGGSFAIDVTGVASVTVSWTPPPPPPPPTVAIATPADGARYAQGEVVHAAYACDPAPGERIDSCAGPAAIGAPIDTSRPGAYEFKVLARTTAGDSSERTVSYTVKDRSAPTIRRLRVDPPRIGADDPRSAARVVFRLDEDAAVHVRVRRARSAGSSRARARVIDGERGINSFRLRAGSGSRALRPGSYVLTLVAVDDARNRSRPATRRFSVVD